MRQILMAVSAVLVLAATSAAQTRPVPVVPGQPTTLYVEHAAVVEATLEQQIPQPSGPVLFCGVQAAPEATSFQVSVDGAAPVALTMDATIDAECPTGQGITHSFTLPASLFPIGNHIVVVRSLNPFGVTVGQEYQVTVGIAPGPFTILFVKAKQG